MTELRAPTRLPPGPIWPSIVQTIGLMSAPLWLMERVRRQHGGAFTICIAGRRWVCFTEPEHVREVFALSYPQASSAQFTRMVEPLFGDASLMLIDGPAHQRQRKRFLAPFRRARMPAYGEVIVQASEAAAARWPLGQPFAAEHRLDRLTLEIILRAVFGLRDQAEVDWLAERLRQHLHASPLMLLLKPLQLDLGPWSPWGRFLRNRAVVHDWILGRVAAARQALAAGAPQEGILSEVIAERGDDGEPLTDHQLLCESLTYIATGFETTSTALSWGLGSLLRAPEVLARLQAELDALGEAPSPEDIAALPYLAATCKEILRVRPVLPGSVRLLNEPTTIGGYSLAAGTQIMAASYLSHQRPESFPDPRAFQPERFLGDKRYGPFEFYPFGGGSRACTGWAFGLYQMQLVLGTLLRRLRLEAGPERWGQGRYRNIVIRPRGGCQLIVRERRPRAAGAAEVVQPSVWGAV